MKSLITIIATILFLAGQTNCYSQNNARSNAAPSNKVFQTQQIQDKESPKIDGKGTEQIWQAVEWSGDFAQRFPESGAAPSETSTFKILYDHEFLYVLVRCHDSQADLINKSMTRRDGFDGDFVVISIDSYNDKNTCFSFSVSAAGVKSDEILTANGNNSDENWNPLWTAMTSLDDLGWTAECRIPLSQLRFPKATNQDWGLQITRRIFRINEFSEWKSIPVNDAGYVSEFGKLSGLKNLAPKRQLEIQPYTVLKQQFQPEQSSISGGLDGKIGLTNDITMDFTINPDFGQVEVDPAAIALDGFQIFFKEQRPFFIENANSFELSISPSVAGNTYGSDKLFYSRRIGKSPSHSPGTNDDEEMSMPDNTTILGAAKVSGKTKDGWIIGAMESLTAKEYAVISSQEETRRVLVEPLTNYFTATVQKEFNERNTRLGVMIGSVKRQLEDHLDYLHESAFSSAIDFSHQWKDRSWRLSARAISSRVSGNIESITATQESITHLFQRVGSKHLGIDTSRTSLEGSGGHLKIGKFGGKHFVFETGVTWRSPELELNDLGFQRLSNEVRYFNWMQYRINEPFAIFNSLNFNFNNWLAYDFEGNRNETSFNINTNAQFKNNWNAGTGFNYIPFVQSNYELRGGPAYRATSTVGGWFYGNTNESKKVQTGMHIGYDLGKDDSKKYLGKNMYVRYRATDALSLTVDVGHATYRNQLQYTGTISSENGENDPIYLASKIEQNTLELSLRCDYSISPQISLQYFAQAFASKGTYSEFKILKNYDSPKFSEKFDLIDAADLNYDENQDEYSFTYFGNETSYFGNPDFNFVQYRSNFVLRWEYLPGSEIFLVWAQGNSANPLNEKSLTQGLQSSLFTKDMSNTFLLKATYRFSL